MSYFRSCSCTANTPNEYSSILHNRARNTGSLIFTNSQTLLFIHSLSIWISNNTNIMWRWTLSAGSINYLIFLDILFLNFTMKLFTAVSLESNSQLTGRIWVSVRLIFRLSLSNIMSLTVCVLVMGIFNDSFCKLHRTPVGVLPVVVFWVSCIFI